MPGLVSVRSQVIALLNGKRIPGKNLITTDGETFYTEMVAGGALSIDFGATTAGLHLGTSKTATTVADIDVNAEITAGRKAISSGYPKYDDDDDDNDGAGASVYTWLYEFSAGLFITSGLVEAAIVDSLTTPTAALCHILFGARFGLSENDDFKIFLNHTVDYTGAVLNSVADGETLAVIDPAGVITTHVYDAAGASAQEWKSKFPPFHKRTSWTDA